MNRRTYRRKWLKLHEKYVRSGFKVFSKSVRDSLSRIPWKEMDKNNYEFFVRNYITNKPILDAYEEFYVSIGLDYGSRIGKALNKEEKLFNPFNFESKFRQFIKEIILSTFGQKITSVRESLAQAIIEIIADSFDQNDSPDEISKNIQDGIEKNKLYRWQTMRIARTEATGAANLGAKKASEESGLVLEKEWISTIDRRTRRKPPAEYDHLEMDGVTVDENEYFNVDGDLLMFPGDPNGQPANIINCRCTAAYLAKRDSEGRLIRKSNN